MLLTLLRIWLYMLAGVVYALLGWNLSHFFLWLIPPLRQYPEVLIFPFITIFLCIGMVLNEIFISNPTRPKRNLLVALKSLVIAIPIGFVVGLIVGILLQFSYNPDFQFPENKVRVFSWLSIGITVGFVEGITWQLRSLEAGNRRKANQRLCVSLFGGTLASLIAAGIFEKIRPHLEISSSWFTRIEDPLGFSLLGILLGVAFTVSSSPSYMAAFRAGKGFEYRVKPDKNTQSIDKTWVESQSSESPLIDRKTITIVSEKEAEKIDEGLSIQLPEKGEINIGSAKRQPLPNGKGTVGCEICLPALPTHLAKITINKRETILEPNEKNYDKIEINGIKLKNAEKITLKHNTLIAFYSDQNDEFNPKEKKMYRFVYYNRFLDAQA